MLSVRPFCARFFVFAFVFLVSSPVVVMGGGVAGHVASATFDTDSYINFGTNNGSAGGVSLGTDYSAGGTDGAALSHFNFGVVKFGDLPGVETLANGGTRKYLTLSTISTGSAIFGISVAKADVEGAYPSGSFGGVSGTADARLAWYQENIKGDDANFGGYAGGAEHLGVLSFQDVQTHSLDVTSAVDAWIDGTSSNFGFGLWAVSSTAVQGVDYDIASTENASFSGPVLTFAAAVPEPASATAIAVLSCGALLRRRRRCV